MFCSSQYVQTSITYSFLLKLIPDNEAIISIGAIGNGFNVWSPSPQRSFTTSLSNHGHLFCKADNLQNSS